MKIDSDPIFQKIVSGGQTGVDRAALDVALKLGLPCGGWCPEGRKAEDGPLSATYMLDETPTANYEQRTKWNVRDSDGTLVLTRGKPSEGTAFTIDTAKRVGKPCLVLDLLDQPIPETVRAWGSDHAIRVLNVAGPRESRCPRIYEEASSFLMKLFA